MEAMEMAPRKGVDIGDASEREEELLEDEVAHL